MPDFGQLIITGGAAGALFWVLKQLVDGKLHTHSEIEGLRADKRELFRANGVLTAANAEANKLLQKILELLEEDEGEGT